MLVLLIAKKNNQFEMPPLHDSMSCSEHMKTNSAEDRTRQESLQQNICSFHVQLTSLRNQQKATTLPEVKNREGSKVLKVIEPV